jgi:hypothetical protein
MRADQRKHLVSAPQRVTARARDCPSKTLVSGRTVGGERD